MALSPTATRRLQVLKLPNKGRAVAHVLATVMAANGHRVESALSAASEVIAMTRARIVHRVMNSSLWTALCQTLQCPMTPESP